MNKRICAVISAICLMVSNRLLCFYLMDQKMISSSHIYSAWILSIILAAPIFMIFSFLLTCIIGLIISFINSFYIFKRLYLIVLTFNSIQLVINSVQLITTSVGRFKMVSLGIGFICNLAMLFFFRRALINYVKVDKIASNIVFSIGAMLATGNLIIGVI